MCALGKIQALARCAHIPNALEDGEGSTYVIFAISSLWGMT